MLRRSRVRSARPGWRRSPRGWRGDARSRAVARGCPRSRWELTESIVADRWDDYPYNHPSTKSTPKRHFQRRSLLRSPADAASRCVLRAACRRRHADLSEASLKPLQLPRSRSGWGRVARDTQFCSQAQALALKTPSVHGGSDRAMLPMARRRPAFRLGHFAEQNEVACLDQMT
jgi:hypothetical protein